jgi:hypothetical protein
MLRMQIAICSNSNESNQSGKIWSRRLYEDGYQHSRKSKASYIVQAQKSFGQSVPTAVHSWGSIPLNSSGQGKIGKYRWRTARNATRLFQMHRSTVYLRFRKTATAIGLRLADQEKRKERAGVAKHAAFAFLLVPFPYPLCWFSSHSWQDTKLYCGDNLDVLRRYVRDESVDD